MTDLQTVVGIANLAVDVALFILLAIWFNYEFDKVTRRKKAEENRKRKREKREASEEAKVEPAFTNPFSSENSEEVTKEINRSRLRLIRKSAYIQ